ncbi:hypothetical protein RRG08_036489 [Elysia crispata]|uniref:Uncharacterized protein n=1 Tax=Elysia crispata TaxID=231223 RepID=A0AAE0ZKJ8_9GAST|nr:hypothetical protein RRG08_036489 [Elysia crispata]
MCPNVTSSYFPSPSEPCPTPDPRHSSIKPPSSGRGRFLEKLNCSIERLKSCQGSPIDQITRPLTNENLGSHWQQKAEQMDGPRNWGKRRQRSCTQGNRRARLEADSGRTGWPHTHNPPSDSNINENCLEWSVRRKSSTVNAAPGNTSKTGSCRNLRDV